MFLNRLNSTEIKEIRRFTQFSSFNQPTSFLATRQVFCWERSCGVGLWLPVTSVLSVAVVGSCLFFIFALAMLQSQESKYFCPFCNHFLKKSEPLGFCLRWGYLAFNFVSSAFSGLVTLSSISFCSSMEAVPGTSMNILLTMWRRHQKEKQLPGNQGCPAAWLPQVC